MSFSSDIKGELSQKIPTKKHCQTAEALARQLFGGKITVDKSEDCGIKLQTNIKNAETVVSKVCCKRAFIRGAFLTSGSFCNPEKSYHFEISSADQKAAEFLSKLLAEFDVNAKIIERKNYYVVYVKDGEEIANVLNIMEAHKALMEFENVRILKELRNNVNRNVNCETANINKTAKAAAKQAEDIMLVFEKIGKKDLPEGLVAVGELRLEHPEASLQELSEMIVPPVGKSGINHRLKKFSDLAENLRS